MPRVHIMTPTLAVGDAVSNDVFGMVRWFRLRNWPADAYAQYLDPALRGKARPINQYEPHLYARDDLLIYHHSVGWPLGLALLERTRNRIIYKYHSITPARFFRPYNKQYAYHCITGDCQTRHLMHFRPERLLADSAFNARELIDAGALPAACRVAAPFHAIGSLDPVPEDEELAERLAGQTNILFVGRVVPNKGHLHLIRAFAHYHHEFDPNSRLIIVGKLDTQLAVYMSDLKHEILRQHLADAVHFTGPVTASQLKTFYLHASLFLCASEHEGFCVPLVEAMYYGVPIVAYGSSAVRGTLEPAGLVWDTPDPSVLAASAWMLRSNPAARAALVESQRQHFFRHYCPPAIDRSFEQALAPLIPEVAACA